MPGFSGQCCFVVRSRRCRFRVLWSRFCWFLALRRLVWFSSVPPHRRVPSSGLAEFVFLFVLLFFFFSVLPFVLLLLR